MIRIERSVRGVGRALLLAVGWTALLVHGAVAQQQDPGARPRSPEEGKEASLPERIESAVVEGSLDALRELREALEGRAERRPDGPTVQDRYDHAFINWRIGQVLPREARKEKQRLLKEAQQSLDRVLESEPGHAEAHALRGSVIGDRINGAFGGMVLGPKANASLDRAHELAPENPRVALQRGIGFFFTPRAFGGGLDKAIEELRRSRELFARQTADQPWPNWGRIDALAWLGQALAKSGDRDGALAAYDEALDLEPDHRWIRGELLPALEDGGKD